MPSRHHQLPANTSIGAAFGEQMAVTALQMAMYVSLLKFAARVRSQGIDYLSPNIGLQDCRRVSSIVDSLSGGKGTLMK